MYQAESGTLGGKINTNCTILYKGWVSHLDKEVGMTH